MSAVFLSLQLENFNFVIPREFKNKTLNVIETAAVHSYTHIL